MLGYLVTVCAALALLPLAIVPYGPALADGTTQLEWDFDGDGRVDSGTFVDERDGFRNTFAYLTIRIAGRAPVEAKWKGGHWAWIDVAVYPGLDQRTPAGFFFTRAVQRRDADAY